jgi:hypothetical protein
MYLIFENAKVRKKEIIIARGWKKIMHIPIHREECLPRIPPFSLESGFLKRGFYT